MRFAAFLAMAGVWGLTWIAAKWATEAASPNLVGGLRLVVACPAFLLWCLIGGIALRPQQLPRLLAASLLINTGCYSFLFWGVAHSPTGLAAIVNLSLIPVFSMLIGALYGEERVTRRRIASVALGAAGLALLFGTRARDPSQGGDIALGLAAVVVGTLSYAWGAIVSKPLVRAMPPAAVACWETGIGGLALLGVSAVIDRPGPADLLALTEPRPLAGLAFLVVGGSLVGFSAYLWLLREWGAFRAGLYAFVSPIIAVGIGALVQGERFGPWEALGMAVMFAATALVAKPDEPVKAS